MINLNVHKAPGPDGPRARVLEACSSEIVLLLASIFNEKAQVGKDQEKAQSEKDPHSKNRGGKKPK